MSENQNEHRNKDNEAKRRRKLSRRAEIRNLNRTVIYYRAALSDYATRGNASLDRLMKAEIANQKLKSSMLSEKLKAFLIGNVFAVLVPFLVRVLVRLVS
jgi:hypothetical protein